MTLLTMTRRVCGRLGLAQPVAVAGSADKQVIQLMELANTSQEELADQHPWQAIRKVTTFLTTAAEAQAGALPADFGRFVDNSFFNRTMGREMVGPLSVREYEIIKARPVFGLANLTFIERQNAFLVNPSPAAGQTVAYEYVSTNFCTGAGGDAPDFVADSDTSYLDERLIRLGMIWRFKRDKGLDYAEEQGDYELALEKAQARDGGAAMLSIAPQQPDPVRVNLPDGNFG